MSDSSYREADNPIHPVHAFLLAACVPLFLGGLLSDLAYSSTYEVQWTNFASWLIAGALVFAGLALLWAFIELLRGDRQWRGMPLIYFLLLLGTWEAVQGECTRRRFGSGTTLGTHMAQRKGRRGLLRAP